MTVWPGARRCASVLAHHAVAWREARPVASLPPGPVLALTAHPDDEALAFGGTLARLTGGGHHVHLLCATAGEASLAALGRRRLGAVRRAELAAASGWLGIADVECAGLPDGRLAWSVDRLATALGRRLARLRPAAVLLPWWGDAHRDHRALSRALALVDAPDGLQVWAGEIWTPLPATHIVDIAGTPLARKRVALAAHVSARRTLDLDAALALARYRALAAPPGCDAAEAFVVAALPAYHALASPPGGEPSTVARARSVRAEM